MIKSITKIVADLSPQLILSYKSQEQCVRRLKDWAPIVYGEQPPTEPAAVLVPLCTIDDEVNLLYTLRSATLKEHGGQISFPGGKTDRGETARETALRETEEELGIPRDNIDVWTDMSPIQGANPNIIVTPILGAIKQFDMKSLKPNVSEVDKIFTVPIKHFCNPDVQGHFIFNNIPLPVYLYNNHKIWGFTAFITHIFLTSLLPENVYTIDGMFNKKFEYHDLRQ